MLISKVSDEEGGKGESCGLSVEDDAHEYQTASQLFDFMAKNQNFDTNDANALTPRDLVLLYQNIDLGTKLMTNAKEYQCQKPNQYVETVVYNDDSDESDMSDVYSSEDLNNVFLINKERLDLFSNQPSLENTLCHKFGETEIETSIGGYNKHFIFKDPYIKEQLNSFNIMTSTNQLEGTVLPASLLDYVCCKRLEDNYNFYMDNIIIYVKNTIEQLKRISNGDYLTDKAKEKWREVDHVNRAIHNDTKVLATSTSIPLHVECKIGGRQTTWDDIVHSAVDIRSLSKILEKKIVVEIPKLISGSYKLLSKCDADNLIISCKKDSEAVDESESRVDVMFQLKRSETGHVMSNINSIMILQTMPIIQDARLPIVYKEKEVSDESNNVCGNYVKITELNTTENDDMQEASIVRADGDDDGCDLNVEAYSNNFEYIKRKDEINDSTNINSNQEDTAKYHDSLSYDDAEIQIAHREAFFDVCPNDLQMSIQNMSRQSVLPEESVEDISQSIPTRRKSPKVRIKSPYENHSYVVEEKKRRKLLEIRERRERKKMALAENCKITKHKYGKGAVMAQASSSVTKLSISNKSFYNSIYGQSENIEPKQLKSRNRKAGGFKKDIMEVALGNLESEQEIPNITALNDTKKFINRSYYLDDTVTEMMFVNMKQDKDDEEKDKGTGSASTSSDYRIKLNILSQLIAPSDSETNIKQGDEIETNQSLPISGGQISKENCSKDLASQSPLHVVPLNTPKMLTTTEDSNELKKTSSIECRKSIDKIYQLINLQNHKGLNDMVQNNTNNRTDDTAGRASLSIQGSDSGTSLKHHLTSSNPSTFSFDKNNNNEVSKVRNKSLEKVTNVISKVIISSKPQIPKIEVENTKRERRGIADSPPKTQENPLKAISQLLHEFENVQKNRKKPGTEQKLAKRTVTAATSNDGKSILRQSSHKRQSRLEQHTDSFNRYNRPANPAITLKDRRTKPVYAGMDVMQNSHQQVPSDERYVDKNTKKKLSDILDEVKEARGEAVKGPSKFNSRLNTLAQPKRIYVQAHSEEYQTRYGRNLITDRLQRLAAAPLPSVADRSTGLVSARNKTKRSSNDAVFTTPSKLPHQSGFPIERQPIRQRIQHSRNNSPESKEKIPRLVSSYKPVNVPEAPEILNKKMVAVESYVKNHYNLTSLSTLPNELQYIKKTRTPLLPNDIDMASVTSSLSRKESTEVGSKIHHIINSIVKSASHGLEILDEGYELNSKSSKDSKLIKCHEKTSLDSDYTRSTMDDETVLSSYDNSDDVSKVDLNTAVEEVECRLRNVQPLQSAMPLSDTNEHALYRPLSLGTFSKHTKVSNLSPKSSIQKIIFLQSNDTGSIVMKASIPQNIQTERLLDLKAVPVLPKSDIDWSFTNIPMQITTVGYAFPEYSIHRCGSPSLCKLFEEVSNQTNQSSFINKSSTRCKSIVNYNLHNDEDGKLQTQFDQVVQVDVNNFKSLFKDQNVGTLEINAETVPDCTSDTSHQVKLENAVEENKCIIDKNEIELDEKKESVVTSKSPDNIDYTTSLDILVGLLNEIQKITTCQTHLTNSGNDESKELQTILNRSLLESSIQSSCFDEMSVNNLSLTSLEKLRRLESDPSLYSYYLSENGGLATCAKIKQEINCWCCTRNGSHYKPICADKEINVDIVLENYVNKPTDVPSIFFPIKINHSTNMTNSITEENRLSSTQSLFSFADFHSTNSNASFSITTNFDTSSKKIIELPKISDTKDDLSIICSKVKQKFETTNEVALFTQNRSCKKDIQKRVNNTKYCLKISDFDPAMKIKRDVLVTVYSVLVLTVFVALSFPEVLYHV